MLSPADFEKVLHQLDEAYPTHPMATVTNREPFKVLICCLLSLRSLDRVTMPVCSRLFEVVDTPEKILALEPSVLNALIRPVRFYEGKVGTLQSVCRELLTRFNGQVPDTMEDLLSIKGVGRKTANLVLSMGFNQPAVCVDTHVHRISNRLGAVATRTPEATEMALRQLAPVSMWSMINRVMVRHGQEICLPRYPRCDICPVRDTCERVDVVPRTPPKLLQT